MSGLIRRFFGKLSVGKNSSVEVEIDPISDRSIELETLEPRTLFSAAPVDGPDQGDAEPDARESVAEEAAVVSPQAAQSAAAAVESVELGQEGLVADQAGSGQSGPTEIDSNQGVTLVAIDDETAALNQETLEAIADVAAERWRATGLTAEQSAALESISYEISDLGGKYLGRTEGSAIAIDDDAAGSGAWFIDPTPGADEEFIQLSTDNSLTAVTGTSASGSYDLLTALMHEQGHVLGLSDAQEGLMDEVLRAGERRVLFDGIADGADPLSVDGASFLSAGSNVSPGELSGMQLLYATDAFTNFDNADNYTTDNSGSIATGSFDRVAYYLELDDGTNVYWVWVSMDAFQTDPALVGVPADGSNIVENGTQVFNLNIESNHPNVATGTGIDGIIEFWASNYSGGGGGLFNSSDSQFDWKDSGGTTGAGHGSMQVANITPGSEEMIFSLTGSGIGIGSQPSGNPDWTFGPNTYNVRNLEVWVGNANEPPVVTSSSGNLTYTPSSGPQVSDSALTVADANDANLSGAVVEIVAGALAEDVLAAGALPAGVTVDGSSTAHRLVLTGTASVADYQAALRAVTYENTNGTPDTSSRQIRFTVTDPAGAAGSGDRFATFVNPVTSSTYVWDNDLADGNWSDATNWDQNNGVPDTGAEIAVFRSVDGTVDLGGATITVDELRFEHSGTLTITNGTLNAGTITATGGGTTTIDAVLNVSTDQTISAGSLELTNTANTITGIWTIDGGGALGVASGAAGTADFVLNGGQLNLRPAAAGTADLADVTSGLVLWADATDLNANSVDDRSETLYADGATISGWLNKAGSVTDVTLNADFDLDGVQSDPAYLLNGLNGLPVIDFDGNDSVFMNDELRDQLNGDYTIMTVARYTDSANGDGRLISDRTNHNWLFGFWSNRTNQWYANGWVHLGSGDDSSWHQHTGTMDGSVADPQGMFYNNGDLQTDTGSSNGNITGRNGNNNQANYEPRQLQLGGWQTGSEFSRGQVAEVIIFDRVLSDTERLLVEGYLNEKWQGATPVAAGDFSANDLTVTGGSTLHVGSGLVGAELGSLTIAADQSLSVSADQAGAEVSFADTTLGGGTATLNANNATKINPNTVTQTAATDLSLGGDGVVTLPVANSYAGTTTLNGTVSLRVQDTDSLGGGDVTVNSGSALVLEANNVAENVILNGSGNGNYSAALFDNSGSTIDFLGTINVASSARIQSQGGGELDLNGAITIQSGADLEFDIDNRMDLDTTITGDATTSITITGGGDRLDVHQSQPNFSGAVRVESQGRLDVHASNGLGSGDVFVTGNDAGVILRGNNTWVNNFNIQGDGRGTEGAIRFEGSTQSVTGVVTLTGNASIYVNNSNATLTQGLAGGFTLTKTGANTTSRLILQQDSANLAGFNLDHGQVRLLTARGLGNSATVDIDANQAVEFDFGAIGPVTYGTSPSELKTFNVSNGTIEVLSGEVTLDANFTITLATFGDVNVGGDGTLNVETPFGNGNAAITNALDHYGFHINNDNLALNLDGNGGMMGGGDPTAFNNFFGSSLLTNGPGNRGLDFNSDSDFINTGSIGTANNYSNLWVGYFTPDASGTWTFRNAGDDDRAGIWVDINQSGVFDSSVAGLGSNRGEQLSWENTGAKTVTLTAGQSYLVAFTHREGGGGSRADFRVRYTGGGTSTVTGEQIVKPTNPNQAGMWSPFLLNAPQNNVTKFGGGTTTLAAANTFNGETTVEAGTLVVSSNDALGLDAGGTTVAPGASLLFDGGIAYTTAEAITVAGNSGGGTVGNLSGSNSFDGTITIGNAGTAFLNSIAGELTINGVVSGTGPGSGITKNGAGVVTLAGDNTFEGVTAVTGGSLIAASNTALGTSAAGATVSEGAVLGLSGGITIAGEAISLNGNGAGSGALLNISGNNVISATSSLVAEVVSLGQVGIGSLADTLTIESSVDLQLSKLNTYGVGDITIDGVISGTPANVVDPTQRDIILGNAVAGEPGFNALAYWEFNDGTAVDSTGNANTGAVGAGVIFSADTGLGSGQAAEFNGEGGADRITIPAAGLSTVEDELTVGFWIKSDAATNPNWFRLMRKGTEANGTASWLPNREGSSDDLIIRYDTFGTGGGFNQNRNGDDVSHELDGNWHQIVFTASGTQGSTGTAKQYVDGVLVSTQSYNHGNGLDNSSDLIIGNVSGNWSGLIDEVFVMDTAVSATQVTTLWDARDGAGVTVSDNSLMKHGAGTLTLNAINTYNGATSVAAGTLIVDGEIGVGDAASAVTIASGATLSGGGTVNTEIAATSTLANIVATGDLVLGLASSSSGIAFQGTLNVGTHQVTLKDSGLALLGKNTILAGGTLTAANGVSLGGGEAISGTGTVQANVTTNSGSLNPGGTGATGALIVDADLNFGAGSAGAYPVEFDASTSDSVAVTGAVNLTNVNLNVATLAGYAPSDGSLLTLIDSQAAGAISGTFNGLADGDEIAALASGDIKAYISYFGGDGNDVTISYIDTVNPGTVTVDDTGADGDTTFELRIVGDTLQVLQNGHVVGARPISSVSALEINGDDATAGGEGDDTFTIDYSLDPRLLNIDITFNGGGQATATGDRLVVTGGSFGTVTHNLTNGTDGNIHIDGDGIADITYTGLEPVDMTGSTATDFIFNLPVGADNAQLSDQGAFLRLESTDGPPTFEQTDFIAPTGSITINGGAGDTLTVSTALTIASDLAIDVPSISLAGNISTTGGTAGGDQTYDGIVTLGASVGLTADDVFLNDAVNLGANDLTVNVSGTSGSTGGGISGTGQLIKQGAGTLTLTGTAAGNNTYAGLTHVQGGTLVLGGGFGGDSGIRGNITVENTATMRLDAGNRIINSSIITVNAGGTFDFNNNGDAVGYFAGAGSIDLGSASITLDLPTAGNGSDFSGDISGTGGLTLRGSLGGTTNRQILSGDNSSFSGAITIDKGILRAAHNNALGSTAGTTTVAGASTKLEVAGGITTAEAITIGAGQTGGGAITSVSGINTFTGAITLASSADFRGSNMTFQGGITSVANQGLSFNGSDYIVDTSAIDLNGGTLTITSAVNNVNNATQLNVAGNDWGLVRINFGGYLRMGVANALPSDTAVEFGWTTQGNSSGTLDLNGFDQTVGSISVTGSSAGLAGDQNITGGGTLTVNQSTTTEYQGRITNGATATSLVKNGAGTLILNNLSGTATSNSGTTTVNAGTLQFGDGDGAADTGTITQGNLTVNSGGAVSVQTDTFNGFNTGRTITINDGGTVSADNSTNNAFNIGALALNGGTLTSANGVGGPANDGGFGNWILNGTVTVGGSTVSTISASTVSIKTGTSFEVADVAAGNDLLVSSAIIDTGGGLNAVVKNGAGTMTLTGTNTYTGATWVNAGTLLINGDSSAATGAVSVASGATLGGTGASGGAVSMAAGSFLSPGISVADTDDIAMANLVINANATYQVQLDGAATASVGAGGALAGSIIFDGGGPRLNIDKANSSSLQAGTYAVPSVSFNAQSTGAGVIRPFLARDLGGGSYETLWVGDAIDAAGGQETVSYAGETFTLASAETIYSGVYHDGVDKIGLVNGVGSSAHDNSGVVVPTTAGQTISGISHGSLTRTYAFGVEVEQIPDHDQVDVTGTVNVTGATLDLSLGYSPSAGDVRVIIDNDGTDAVTGTFSGLAEGASPVDGEAFTISYVGGDGNDVVLFAGAAETDVAIDGSGNLVISDINSDSADDVTVEIVNLGGTNYYQISDSDATRVFSTTNIGSGDVIRPNASTVQVKVSAVTGGLIVSAPSAAPTFDVENFTIASNLNLSGNALVNAGATDLEASVTTSGVQTYNTDVNQGALDVTLTATTITFNGTTTLHPTGGSNTFTLNAASGGAENTAGNLFDMNGGRLRLINGTELVNNGNFETGENAAVPIFATNNTGNKLTNNGTFTHNGSQLRLYVEITNTATGTFNFENSSGTSEIEFKTPSGNGPGGVLRNQGTVNITGANNHQIHEAGTASGGVINESGGIINFSGGTTTLAESAKFSNASGGILNFNSGTWTLNAGDVTSNGTTNLKGNFTLSGSASLINGATGILELSAAGAARTLTLNNPGFVNNGLARFTADGNAGIGGAGTFTNNGTFNHQYGGNNDNLVLSGSLTFQNNGTFDLKNRGDVQFGDGSTSSFVNNGMLVKSVAGTDPSFFFSFDKASGTFSQTALGTVEAQAGRLRIASQNNSSDAAGTWTANGGDIEFAETWTGTVTGTATGTGDFRITNADNGSIESNFAAGAGGVTFDVSGNGLTWDEQNISTTAGNFTNIDTMSITTATAKNLTGGGELITGSGGTTTVTGTVGQTGGSLFRVANGGLLQGTGTINAAVTVDPGGTLAPGLSPGVIASGDLDIDGNYDVEVVGFDGAGNANGHDQTVVTGTVDLDATTSMLNLDITGLTAAEMNSNAGSELVIIGNNLADPVIGDFSNFAEGEIVSANIDGTLLDLVITYHGGTGNDVSLIAGNLTTRIFSFGNNLIIEDINDVTNDQLTVEVSGGNLVITEADTDILIDAQGVFDGTTGDLSNVVTIGLGTFTGNVILRTVGGNDTMLIENLDLTGTQGLTVEDGTGTDSVTFQTAASNLNNGNVNVTADSIAVNAAVDAGTNGDVTLNANGTDVTISADVTTAGTGAVDVDAVRQIVIDSGATVSTVNGGIDLSANAAGTTSGNFVGVSATNATVETSGSGDISIFGRGGDAGSQNDGITLVFSQVRSTATGATSGEITLAGSGGNGTTDNHGVSLSGNTTRITSFGGDIQIDATGGDGSGLGNRGFEMQSQARIESIGAGMDAATITINGTGGDGTRSNYGVAIIGAGTGITSADGDVAVSGTANGTDDQGYGVFVVGADIESTGIGVNAASISIDGTGGNGTSSNDAVLIFLDASIASTDGSISVTGTGGGGFSSHAVAVDRSTIETVNGSIDLTGVARDGNGVRIILATVEATGSGDISIEGESISNGDTGVFIFGSMLGDSEVKASSGDIKIVGASTTSNGVLVRDFADVISTGGGKITIEGTGAFLTGSHGVRIESVEAEISSAGGDIEITGDAATGDGGDGVLIDEATVSASGSGKISITGIGGNDSGDHGVRVTGASAAVTTVNGDIVITGESFNDDDFRNDTGGTITSTSGEITINADDITIGANISSSGQLFITPRTASTTIGLGGGSGTLNLDDSELGFLQDGFSSITIGDAAAGTGAVDIDSSTFVDDVTIVGGSISVTELNAGANDATLTARTGAITDGGDGGTDVTGDDVSLNANVTNGTAGVVTNSSSGAFAVSGTDLLEGITGTVTGTALGGNEGTSNDPAVLTNGQFGTGGNPLDLAQTVSIGNNTTITWQLDTGASPDGYAITNINTYSGWRDAGRDNQNFTARYATVDNPGVFIDITNVSFAPSPANSGESLISADGSGIIAQRVGEIQLFFGGQENNYAGYREIDVIGVPSVDAIGEAGDEISLQANTITTDTSGANGNQFLSETDTVTINGFDAGSGTVNLDTSGEFDLTTDAVDAGTFVVVDDGTTFDVNGAANTVPFAGLTVNDGGTLKGDGDLFTTPVTVNDGGLGTPGNTPGVIATGNLTLNSGSTFFVELDGTAGAGAVNGHDQYDVTGTVSIDDATLSLDTIPGTYTPTAGDQFVIINNDGADAVMTGTFAGLAEGTFVSTNDGGGLPDHLFQITYLGTTGTGNDVVLEATGETATTNVYLDGGGNLVVEDIDGADTEDNLRIEKMGTDYVIEDLDGNALGTLIVGATQTDIDRVVVPMSVLGANGGIIVRTLGEDDTVTIGDLGTLNPNGELTVDGGAGQDGIVQTGDATLAGTGAVDYDAETIYLQTGSSLTTDTGDVDLDGTGVTGNGVGVRLRGADIISTSGNVSLTGSGGDSGVYNRGILLENNPSTGEMSTINTGGSITLDGTGGTGIHATGVTLINAMVESTGAGPVTIIGQGGSGTLFSEGVAIHKFSTVDAGTGALNITGTGGSTGNMNRGIIASNSDLDSAGGNITLKGLGGGTLMFGIGVELIAVDVTTSGNGLVTIQGTGATGTLADMGVRLSGAGTISTVDGAILIEGTANGSSLLNHGAQLTAGTTVEATGDGSVTIRGTSGAGTVLNHGVFISAFASVSVAEGNLNVEGTSRGTMSLNKGVAMSHGTLTATGGGNVVVSGTGGQTANGVLNSGIEMVGGGITSATGNITLSGNGGSGSSLNQGIRIVAATIRSTSGGALSLTGEAHSGTSGVLNSGVYLLSMTLDSTGSIGVTGTGGGGTLLNHGIYMQNVTTPGSAPATSGTAGTGNLSEDKAGNFF